MNTIGITRKIDKLGRIVIPKEIRRNLNIKNSEDLSIQVADDKIILSKQIYIKSYVELSQKICDIVDNCFNFNLIITDKKRIIATSKHKQFLSRMMSKKLFYFLNKKLNYVSKYNEKLEIVLSEILTGYFVIVPIITSFDILGLVIINSTDNENYLNIGKLVSQILSEKIDIC